MSINDFKDSISDSFDVFNKIASDNNLLVALYDRYKRCVEAGNDDCLEVAIGNIQEFFDKVKEEIDDDITDEDILDMYEDYFEEQETLDLTDVDWGEWLDDLGKAELDRFTNQQDEAEQDQAEDDLDKDEDFEMPVEQIEAPETEEVEEEAEEEVKEEAFENPIGDIGNVVSVPGSGSYKYDGGLFISYNGSELLIDPYQLERLWPDLYEKMMEDDEISGNTAHYLIGTIAGETFTPNMGLTDTDASNFLIAYYYYILNAYSKTGSIIISEEGQQSILWSEDSTEQDLLTLLWSYYETGNINAIESLISMESFSDSFLSAVQNLDMDNDFTQTENFYEHMAYLIYTMEDTYEDYTYSDVYGYMKENADTFSSSDFQNTISTDSVIDYYENNGYTYDDADDTLYTTEEYNKKYDIEYEAINIDAGDIEPMEASDYLKGVNTNTYVNMVGSQDADRNNTITEVYQDKDGNWVYDIDIDILDRLYEELYADLNIPSNGQWSGDTADNFISLLFYTMYYSYLENGEFEDLSGDSQDFWSGSYYWGMSVEGKEYLQEIVDWYNIYGNFDDITQSTDYAKMVYYLGELADMNATDATAGENVFDGSAWTTEGADGLAEGWIAFFEVYNYNAYYFGQVYENYTAEDVLNFMSENTDALLEDRTTLIEDITTYYTDQGYMQSIEDGKVYSPDDITNIQADDAMEDLQEPYQFEEQELDEYESPLGSISNVVSVPYSDYKYKGNIFVSYDGNELIIDPYQLQILYPDLYDDLMEIDEISGTTTHALMDTIAGETFTPNMGLTGDDATNFLISYYYYMLNSYVNNNAEMILTEDGGTEINWGIDDETEIGVLELLWGYYNTDDMETLTQIITLEDYADVIMNYIQDLDDDNLTYTTEFYDNLAYLIYTTDSLTNEINYSDVYAYMADNYDEMNQDDITQTSIYDYYTEKGYTYDSDTNKLLTQEEVAEAEDTTDVKDADADVAVDTDSEEYKEFVEKMEQYLGDMIRNITTDVASDEFLQELYSVYVNRDTDEYKNYKQFGNAVLDLESALNNAYDELGYTVPTQTDLNNLLMQYISNYGITDEINTDGIYLDDDGKAQVLEVETASDIAEDTPKTTSDIDGYYFTQDADGTYRVYMVKNGQLSGSEETFQDDSFLTAFGDIDFNELDSETLEYITDFGEYNKEDITSEVVEKYADTELVDAEDKPTEGEEYESDKVGGHIRDINNSLNPYQITENMGRIELNQRKPTSKNIKYRIGQPKSIYNEEGKMLFGVNYDGSSRIEHIPDDSQLDYETENGKNLLRLDGSNRKLTKEEWKIIEESYLYDRDISKPFIVDKLEDPEQYKVNYNNVYEYYFALSNRNKNFFVWLDSYKEGEEGRSYINYRVSSKIQSNNVDIESYVKTGSILDLLPSIDFQPHFNNQGSQAQKKSIVETHALGIENVNTFVLASSLCSLFSNLIMENAKHIGKNKVVQDIESGFSKGDYTGLQDNIYTGIYKEGSSIKNAITDSNLSDAQKNVLNVIFSERSFKSIADYEINNRYGEIVLKFFGNNDERKHKLENNSGKILFELGCIYLSYYACMMDNDELLGIDTSENSNLIKITSEFLETLYPAPKYDANLLTGIDNLIKLYTREIRNIKHGNVANEITAKDLLSDVIRDMIEISFNETPTTFNVYDFFNETLMGHIINNFGSEMYMKIATFDSMVDFLADGFLDSQQFNQMIKYVMTSTMGERFNFKGSDMLETLFMSNIQAQTFINNSKYNILIPVIHPEIIDLVPPSKVNINLWGFNAKIVGFVEYDKKMPIYDTAIQEDIKFKTTNFEEEPEFLTEEDAEKRGEEIGLEGTHQHENGTYMVGNSHEELEKFYGKLDVNNQDFDNIIRHYNQTIKPNIDKNPGVKIADIEHRIMVEDEEDIKEVDTYEMGKEIDDWKLAGIVEIVNKQPREHGALRGTKPIKAKTLKETLKETITDFDDNIELTYPSEGSDYVIIKDNNNVYVAFRGSKLFGDWIGETGNLRNMDTSSFYSMATGGIGQNHQGFKKGYDKMQKELIDNLNKNLDKDSNLYILGHSRGTAFADQLVEDAIRIHPKDKIKYRGFGYITHRNKENAEQMNKKIKGMDYLTYHIAGDPLRLTTKILPYYPIGKNKVITGYEKSFSGNPFMSVDINSLAEIKDDKDTLGQTIKSDIWRVLRSEPFSEHFMTAYKNLLAQDKHEFKFRKQQDKTYNTPLNYEFMGTAILAGYGLYKGVEAYQKQTDIAEKAEDARKKIKIEKEKADVRVENAEGILADQGFFTQRKLRFQEEEEEDRDYYNEGIKQYEDAEFRKGGKIEVDDGVKVDSYEKGGVVENFSKSLYKSDCKQDCEEDGDGQIGIIMEYGGKVENKNKIKDYDDDDDDEYQI